MNCPACGYANRDDARFCGKCAAPLPTEREPRDYAPKHLAEKILDARAALEGECKNVIALFADIKGSMELLEDLDPEEPGR